MRGAGLGAHAVPREGQGLIRRPLFRFLPKLDPEDVAERAWRGFKSGRRLVVPGFSSKLAVLAAALLPSAAMLPLIGKLQRSGNDPCTCGSGRKFKKCCGARTCSYAAASTQGREADAGAGRRTPDKHSFFAQVSARDMAEATYLRGPDGHRYTSRWTTGDDQQLKKLRSRNGSSERNPGISIEAAEQPIAA